jgi:predicted DNA-binding transcriptional regulator AlpA
VSTEAKVTKHPEFLSAAEVAQIFGVSVRTVFRWSRASSFPSPKRLSRRSLRWDARDIESFLQSQNQG